MDKMEVYIALIAALICAAVNIAINATSFEMATRMIGVIILFYLLGLICKAYLRKKVFPEPDEPDESIITQDDDDELGVEDDGD